jgi:hypothetical protein
VTAIIVIGIVAAANIGLGTAFGGPLVGVILGALLIIGALVRLFTLGGTGIGAGEVAREDQEFFGPGRLDDPNR